MSVLSALRAISDLAEGQHGMFTTRQAGNLGVERRDLARLTAAGSLERIAHGVYRVAGAPRSRFDDIRAAWLQLAPGIPAGERGIADGVVSHTTAAILHGAELFAPFGMEFTIPPSSRRLRPLRDDIRIHRAEVAGFAEWGRGEIEGILLTTPARTIADLAAVRVDLDHLFDAAGDIGNGSARDSSGRQWAQLPELLDVHAGAYGFADGRQFADAVDSAVGDRREVWS